MSFGSIHQATLIINTSFTLACHGSEVKVTFLIPQFKGQVCTILIIAHLTADRGGECSISYPQVIDAGSVHAARAIRLESTVAMLILLQPLTHQ